MQKWPLLYALIGSAGFLVCMLILLKSWECKARKQREKVKVPAESCAPFTAPGWLVALFRTVETPAWLWREGVLELTKRVPHATVAGVEYHARLFSDGRIRLEEWRGEDTDDESSWVLQGAQEYAATPRQAALFEASEKRWRASLEREAEFALRATFPEAFVSMSGDATKTNLPRPRRIADRTPTGG